MYTPMTVVVSLILIGLGAVLTWGVNDEPEGLDLTVVGVILMLIGLASLLLALLLWSSWRPGYRRRVYADAAPVRRRAVVEEPSAYPARRVDVIEEEDVPPAGPVGPPPP